MRAVIFAVVLFGLALVFSNYVYSPPERQESVLKLEKYKEEVEALNENPRSFDARMRFAFKLLEENQPELARVQLSQALSINPDSPQALAAFARLSFDEGDFEVAYKAYATYLQDSPNDTQAKVEYALTAMQLGLVDKALQTFEALLAEEPGSFQAKLGYALALFMTGDKDAVAEQLDEAKQISPDQAGLEQIRMLEQKLEGMKSPGLGEFFARHLIIGPKLDYTEQTGTIFKVYVKEFPVEQMPEFAKQKLISSVQQQLNENETTDSVELLDAETKESLMLISQP